MRSLLSCIVAVAICAPCLAVGTSHWVHTTEADFKQGTFSRVVATNLGDLKLSRQVRTLLEEDPRIDAVYCLAQGTDGTVYAGTGPGGTLLAIKDDKVTTAAEVGDNSNIYSLLVDSQGRLLIGTGGEKGQILRIDSPGAKPQPIFSAEGVQYIWALLQAPDGMIYAATGPNGQLFEVSPSGASKVLFDSDENNLLCLAGDGADLLYVGSDPNGLLYRINRKTAQVFVLYDAPESEISALVRDARGNLYAATAESTQAQAATEGEGAAEQTGRPEQESHDVPIPSEPPPTPKPPEVPKPAPGDPLPIPKTLLPFHPMSMVTFAADGPDADDPGDEPPAGPGGGSPPTTGEAAHPTSPAAGHHAGSPMPEQAAGTNGNAIYRIDPDGFVTEVFRQNVQVYAMVEQAGSLLVATGSEGEIFQVNPAAEETIVLAKVDPKEVMCLLAARDGRVYMGLGNSGEVATMSAGYAEEGSYTSPVLDAQQISRFGKIHLKGTLPRAAKLTVETRSGNVEEATDPGWSAWSGKVPAVEFVQVASPSARFLQYRLNFTGGGDGKETPVVEEVDVAYQVPNLSPRIKSIKIARAEKPASDSSDESASSGTAGGSGKLTITWEASDPNEDALVYSLHFRTSPRGPWILLKEDLKDSTYDWDTRAVADGQYQIRVQASDADANAAGKARTSSRVSDPVVVDNTSPVIGDVKLQAAGSGDVTIALNVADRTGTIAQLAYNVDGEEDWHTVLPSDNIADSPEEAYRFTIPGLAAGSHQITVRAADDKGNRAFQTLNASIERTAAR